MRGFTDLLQTIDVFQKLFGSAERLILSGPTKLGAEILGEFRYEFPKSLANSATP